jgi:hypothetical protein
LGFDFLCKALFQDFPFPSLYLRASNSAGLRRTRNSTQILKETDDVPN